MREASAVVSTTLSLAGRMHVVTRYGAVDEFLRDHERFVRDPNRAEKKQVAGLQWWMPRILQDLAQNLLTVGEPDHRRIRKLAEQAFLRTQVDEMRDRVFHTLRFDSR